MNSVVMNNKRRVLFISSFPTIMGGGQRSLCLLLKHLNKDKFSAALLVSRKDSLSDEAARLGVEVFIFPLPRLRSANIPATLKGFWNLLNLVREHKIGAIHADSTRETFYAGLVGKICHIPVIMHVRVIDRQWWVDHILYNLVDRFIVVSYAIAERFKPFDAKDKVRVVYNGVDLDVFKPHEEGHDSNILRVGYFGEIRRRKGIEVLIKAAQKVSGAIEVLIMGSGDQVYLCELKNMAIGLPVTFEEFKKDIVRYMTQVDVIVMPALKGEGLPRIIIESMAMGKPVIASDIVPNREVLGKELEEFIFPVNDAAALASKLEKISKDKSILSSKKNILRSRAELYFEIKKNTAEIENIYDAIFKSNHD